MSVLRVSGHATQPPEARLVSFVTSRIRLHVRVSLLSGHALDATVSHNATIPTAQANVIPAMIHPLPAGDDAIDAVSDSDRRT